MPRLQILLSCWSPDDGVVVGERYGYNVHSTLGYNYPTGGGGIAVSVSVLATLATHRRCPADDAPDDMYLGLSLTRLNITLVHSPAFHQVPLLLSSSVFNTHLTRVQFELVFCYV